MHSYSVQIPDKGTYTIESPTELSDEQAYQYALIHAQEKETHQEKTGIGAAFSSGLSGGSAAAKEGIATLLESAGATGWGKGLRESAAQNRAEAEKAYEGTTEEDIAAAEAENGPIAKWLAQGKQKIAEPLGHMAGRFGPTTAMMAVPGAGIPLAVGNEYLASIGELQHDYGATPEAAMLGGIPIAALNAAKLPTGPLIKGASNLVAKGLGRATPEAAEAAVRDAARVAEEAKLAENAGKVGPFTPIEQAAMGVAPHEAAQEAAKAAASKFATERTKAGLAGDIAAGTIGNLATNVPLSLATEELSRRIGGKEGMSTDEALGMAGDLAYLAPVFGLGHGVLRNPLHETRASAEKAAGKVGTSADAITAREIYELTKNAHEAETIAATPFHPEHEPAQVWDAMREHTGREDVAPYTNLSPEQQATFSEALTAKGHSKELKDQPGVYVPNKNAVTAFNRIASKPEKVKEAPAEPTPAPAEPAITLAKKLGVHPNSNLGKALNGLDTSDPNNAIAASDMLRAAEGSYKGKINETAVNEVHAVADQMRTAQPQTNQETPASQPSGVTFKTAKGSTYDVNSDGTTTRNKAFRPEHGEEEQGVQPTSHQTFYVDSKGLNALGGHFQSTTPSDTLAHQLVTDNGHAAVRRVDTTTGQSTNPYAASVTPIHTQPAVGLYPVEVWDNGGTVHFGNKIIELNEGKQTEPARQPEAVEAAKPVEEAKPLRATDADINALTDKISDIREQLKDTYLEPEERAALRQELTEANAQLTEFKKSRSQKAEPVEEAKPEELQDTYERNQGNLNANNQPIAHTLKAIKNFWDWFHGAKVVDAEGKPLVLYHGTDADITAFDRAGLGAHFTPDYRVASEFSESFDNNQKVFPVYLNLKNPLRIKDSGFSHSNAATVAEDFVRQGILPDGYINDAFYARIMDGVKWPDIDETYQKNNANELINIRKIIEKQGYDGLVYVNTVEGGGDSYVAFHPEQVKSATGNSGAFDANNPDIRYSRASQVETPEFKKWFGESKVMDAEGKPMVVYHGTDADFTEFDTKAERANRGNNPEGVYLTPDENEARGYGKNVMALYAKAENTYVEGTSKVNQKMAEKYAEVLKNNYPGYGDSWVDSVLVPEFIETGKFKDIAGNFKTEVMQAGGYDSWKDGRHIVVFNPTQVKSATGNQGTFSPEEKSIVKSKAKTSTNAHTADTLQQALNKRYGNNAPKVNIGTRAGVDNDSTVQGFYDPATKSVTLIPENIDQSKDLHGLIRHEIAVHAKRLGKTDAEFKGILKQLKVLKESNKAVQEAYARVPKDTAAESVHEEALGYLVEHAKNLPLVKRFMSWLRRMAHKLTGSSSWLRADDFAKLADEVLSNKTSAETVAHEKASLSYSKSQQPAGMASIASSEEERLLKNGYVVTRQAPEKTPWKKSIENFWKKHINEWVGIENKLAPHFSEIVDKQVRADIAGKAYAQSYNLINTGLRIGGMRLSQFGTVEVTELKTTLHNGKVVNASLDSMQTLADALGANGRDIIQNVAYVLDTEAQLKRNPASVGNHIKQDMPKFKQAIADANAMRRQHPEIDDALNMWRKINDSLIDLSFDSGLIDAKTKAAFKAEKNYFPKYMLREEVMDRLGVEEGKPVQIGNTYTKVFRERVASEHEVNMWENMARHYAGVTMGAAANQFKKLVGEQFVVVGAAKKVKASHTNAEKGNMAVMVNGKREFYKLDDPSDVPALMSIQQDFGPLMQAARGSAQILRFGALSNPAYWVRQIVRDPIAATLASDLGWITPAHTMKELTSILQGKNAIFDELVRSGIVGHVDPTMDIKDVHGIMRDIGKPYNKQSAFKSATNSARNKLERMHIAVDGATRVAVYKEAYAKKIREGGSPSEAKAYAVVKARESINFAIKGSSQSSRNARTLIPFLSAGINGLELLRKAATGANVPLAKRAEYRRQFLGKVATLGLMSAAYTMYMSGDEDYENIPESRRYNNWMLPTHSKDHPFVAISLPPEFAFVKWLPEMMVRYSMGTQTGKEVLASATKQLQMMVPGGMGYTGIPIPQMVRPAVEAMTGHSFFTGEDIVSAGDKRKSTVMQGANSATEMAKWLSEHGGAAVGMSPAIIDHLFRGYGAELGTAVAWAADSIFAPSNAPEKAEKDWVETPGLGLKGIFGKLDESQFRNDFYEHKNEADSLRSDFNSLKASGDIEGAKKYIADPNVRKKMEIASEMDKIGKKMQNLGTYIRLIQNNPNLNSADKAARIHKIKQAQNKLARDGEKKWSKAVE